jgi:hypothetical protein
MKEILNQKIQILRKNKECLSTAWKTKEINEINFLDWKTCVIWKPQIKKLRPISLTIVLQPASPAAACLCSLGKPTV